MTAVLNDVEALVRELSEATQAPEGGCESVVAEPSVLRPTTPSQRPTPARRVRGYQRPTAGAPWPPAGVSGPGLQAPRVLPKRPTGRIFIGGVLATLCLTMSWMMWDACWGVVAFGVVKADTLSVGPEWDGELHELKVVAGQRVQVGELLAVIKSTDLEFRRDRLQHELKVEQANLAATELQARQQARTQTAEYFELWASLEKQREELTRLEREWQRLRQVRVANAISNDERDRVQFALQGQGELVTKLSEALDALRERDAATGSQDDRAISLEPVRARIEALTNEIAQVSQQIEQGQLRSPVAGVVVRRSAAVGQKLVRLQPIFEIVDDESLRIELFVPQQKVDSFQSGQKLNVTMEPATRSIECEIAGTRQCFESAPDSLARFYSHNAALMPLMLKPRLRPEDPPLQAGAVTKLSLLQSFGWQ